MKKPRICVLTASYPNVKYPINGVFIKEQVTILAELGTDITLIAPRISKKDKYEEKDGPILVYRFPFLSGEKLLSENKGIPIFRILSYLLSGTINTFKVVRKRGCSLIHAHWAIPTGLVGIITGKYLLKKPVVITAHGSDIIVVPEKNYIARKLLSFTLRKADHVIATYEELRKRVIEDYSIDPGKVTMINMGVNTSTFKPQDRQEAKETLGLPINKKIILFLGNLVDVKGPQYLIEAIPQITRKHKDTLTIFVGDGSLRKDLEKKIKNEGLDKYTRFVGDKPHEQIPTWLNAADILVDPSGSEGLGLAGLEAISCQTPVIASKSSVIVDKSIENEVLVVKPKDPAAIALGVDTFLEKRTKKKSNNFQNRVFPYDQKRKVDEVYSIYERLTKEDKKYQRS